MEWVFERSVVMLSGSPQGGNPDVVAIPQQVRGHQALRPFADDEIGPLPDQVVVVGLRDLSMCHRENHSVSLPSSR